MKKCFATVAVLAVCVPMGAQQWTDLNRNGIKDVYEDPAAPIEQRVEDLLSQMTLEEKCYQMWSIETNRVLEKKLTFDAPEFKHSVGQLCRSSETLGTAEVVGLVNSLQRHFRENTRLGIPVMMHEETLHGVIYAGATNFPQAIARACSWNSELEERVGAAVGKETRSRGGHMSLSPVLDIGKDPRYGRIEESYGEDPYLAGVMGIAVSKGMQGSTDRIDEDHIGVTAKHFCASGSPLSGQNTAPNMQSQRTMLECDLVPFRMLVESGYNAGIMAGYAQYDGISCHGSKYLLTDLLRDSWGFKGVVVSDYNGIGHLTGDHIAATPEEAAKITIEAGMNIELNKVNNFRNLVAEVEAGRIDEALIDRAVRYILSVKFRLGLFENPYADVEKAKAVIHCAEHQALALEAAQESAVLLKNDNHILPLNPADYKSIAVIGPVFAHTNYGGYSTVYSDTHSVSISQGIRDYVGNKTKIIYAEGCKIHEGNGYWREDDVQEFVHEEVDRALIKEAVKAAKKADIIILGLGGTPKLCGEKRGDRDDLGLFGRQMDLFNAMLKLGKPIVVYLSNGRPLAIPEIKEKADAILEGFYLGEATHIAVPQILFGEVNPSGKLTTSFPNNVGQVPIYYYRKALGGRAKYLGNAGKALFPFGFGLSYTTFEYSDLKIDKPVVKNGDTATVSVTVTNTGDYDGKEVVEMYVSDLYGSVARPDRALKGFQKVSLAKGESKRVSFTLGFDELKILNRELKEVVEPGDFNIYVGGSLNTKNFVTLTVE